LGFPTDVSTTRIMQLLQPQFTLPPDQFAQPKIVGSARVQAGTMEAAPVLP
jgi:hypothetical protein